VYKQKAMKKSSFIFVTEITYYFFFVLIRHWLTIKYMFEPKLEFVFLSLYIHPYPLSNLQYFMQVYIILLARQCPGMSQQSTEKTIIENFHCINLKEY
jgi:hypothetical protein